MSSDLEKLRAFVQELFTDWPHEFGIDGFDLQDLAEKHGLIEPREVSAPCHPEHCACAEYDDFPQTCYRKTALLTGSTVSPPPSRIGPTEPDDTMVICPVCTSQFRAIPLDVQRARDELLAVAKRALDVLNEMDDGPDEPFYRDVQRALHAAIAKATGEAK